MSFLEFEHSEETNANFLAANIELNLTKHDINHIELSKEELKAYPDAQVDIMK